MQPEATTGLTSVHLEAVDRSGAYALVRRALGVSSFGLNVVELEPGAAIPEHDETERDQEEVFFVVRGAPAILVDGERVSAPEGTFVRLDPDRQRRIVNDGAEPATVLVVSAPTSSGYRPMEWA